MKRRSPIKHRVKAHERNGRRVKSHTRGSGKRRKPRVTLKRRTLVKKMPINYIDYDFSFPDTDRTRKPSALLTTVELKIVDTHHEPPEKSLYHITDKLSEILASNTLVTRGIDEALNLTANPRLRVISPGRVGKKYRIELNFKKLRKDYPDLVPRYYSYSGNMPDDIAAYYEEHSYHNPMNYPNATTVMGGARWFSNESEWLLKRPIKNLAKYIVRIEAKAPFVFDKKWNRVYDSRLDPEKKRALGEKPPPKYVYHYTSGGKAQRIKKEGLIPTDRYNKGDMPVIWFFKTPRPSYGEMEVRVRTDAADPKWITRWGGSPGAVVYADWIPPERLRIRKVRFEDES